MIFFFIIIICLFKKQCLKRTVDVINTKKIEQKTKRKSTEIKQPKCDIEYYAYGITRL